MAQPSTRQELIDYCLRQLGAPVLEINVAEEQVQDLVDDASQYFQIHVPIVVEAKMAHVYVHRKHHMWKGEIYIPSILSI